ncbi:ATP-binding protein [Hymenobacter fastidiosus]|uniref:histidine kinase n=1 Tax=Hymenobacter fastidiosus TaxID=486264 RepID=A0ABP7RXS1_9BACT
MKRVLLIDDNAADRMLYRRYLAPQPAWERLEFAEAATGAEALVQFMAWQPDCILLDYDLPDTSGLLLLASLQALAPADTLCVVMITGRGNETLAVRALREGALDYLVKQQFDPALLHKTVTHAIEKNEWRQYVARYHHQLQAVNQQLARTNQDLDNFVYAASHDLKQPVHNLMGLFAELRRTATFHDADEAVVLRLIDEALRSLSTTIHDLAAVVQEQRQPAPQPAEPVVLAELTAEVAQALRPERLAIQAQLSTDFAALPAVEYVRGSLRTILFNLVSNALKYHQPGRPLRVQVRTYADAGRPVLEVQDNGLGIDLDRYGAELFHLFRRFHPAAGEGTGVGLFLVNRLVESCGGHIEVDSQAGSGTTFRVYLCLTPRPPATGPEGRRWEPAYPEPG